MPNALRTGTPVRLVDTIAALLHLAIIECAKMRRAGTRWLEIRWQDLDTSFLRFSVRRPSLPPHGRRALIQAVTDALNRWGSTGRLDDDGTYFLFTARGSKYLTQKITKECGTLFVAELRPAAKRLAHFMRDRIRVER